ncbi:unnamed protein product [Diplocarpon coronariae]
MGAQIRTLDPPAALPQCFPCSSGPDYHTLLRPGTALHLDFVTESLGTSIFPGDWLFNASVTPTPKDGARSTPPPSSPHQGATPRWVLPARHGNKHKPVDRLSEGAPASQAPTADGISTLVVAAPAQGGGAGGLVASWG